jgi:hypothetical protein
MVEYWCIIRFCFLNFENFIYLITLIYARIFYNNMFIQFFNMWYIIYYYFNKKYNNTRYNYRYFSKAECHSHLETRMVLQHVSGWHKELDVEGDASSCITFLRSRLMTGRWDERFDRREKEDDMEADTWDLQCHVGQNRLKNHPRGKTNGLKSRGSLNTQYYSWGRQSLTLMIVEGDKYDFLLKESTVGLIMSPW